LTEAVIHPWGVAAGYLMTLIPLGVIYWYKLPMMGQALLAMVRMTIQLVFVGLYLQVVFRLNNFWLNLLWLVVMVAVADGSILKGCGLKIRVMATEIFIALLVGVAIPLIVFVGVVLSCPNVLDARLMIPIAGMILGNCMRADIVGIRTFYQSLAGSQRILEYRLGQSASLSEATRPFVIQALQQAMTPTVATMATFGLVSLPGMMTGVILGGNDPMTAIQYQIAIMLSIFTGTSITVTLGIRLSARRAFNAYGIPDKSIFA